jgi:tetratricopeptide (TPR) repeat protein
MSSPLQGDPNRQAVDPIAGYLYQIWQSVFTWINLEPSEVLYLEGTEDFDIVGTTEATAVQVRRTAAPITLGLKKTIEAIVQFWALRAANTPKRVAFRYLTTSEPGYESGSPFGASARGIDVWERCKKHPEGVESIRRFLLNRDDLQGELRLFLRAASSEEMLQELILPIAWVTGQRDTDDLQNAIADIIIVRGEALGIQPSEAASIGARLFQEVCNAVIRPRIEDRVLTRSHFLKIFEQATSVSVSRSRIQLLEISVNALARGLGQTAEGITFVESAVPMQSPPDLASDIFKRNDLIESVKANVERLNLYLLSGSAGTGKTTLAAQVAESWQGVVVWMTLRSLSPESTGAGIRRATASIISTSQKCLVILDDIDFLPASFHRFEPQLASLLLVAHEKDACILFSSQRPLPQQFSRRFNTSVEHMLRVPMLNRQEIRHYCAQQGCPQIESDFVAANILVKTRGHPTLVHALLKQSVLSQWRGVADDLSADHSDVLLAERRDARQLLSGLSEPTRDLLYRLSLIEDQFRQEHALKIGELEPPVALPGDRFDQVIGPWIEPLASGYYQISPLLSGEAEHVWSAEKCRKFHGAIAEAILTSEPRTVIEANTVLRHAWKARSLRNLYRICGSLSLANNNIVRSAFGIMVWFATISLGQGDVLLEEDNELSGMLRLLQYRIARQADERLAEAVLQAWTNETERRDANLVERFLLSTNLTVFSSLPLAPNRLFQCLETIQEAETHYRELIEKMERDVELEPSPDPVWDAKTLFEVATLSTLSRYKDIQEFENLLAGLREADDPLRARILAAVAKSRISSTLMVDRVWMSEADKPDPDWQRCLEAFREALASFATWNQPILIDVTIRGMVVVEDEYLGASAEALEELGRLTSKYDRDSGLLRTTRVTVLSNLGRLQETVAVARDSIGLWENELDRFQIRDIWGLRSAAIAASKLRRWRTAAELFDKAHMLVRKKYGHQALALGLKADTEFAKWNAGETDGWVPRFASLLRQVEMFGAEETHLSDAFRVRKLIGACFLWILKGFEPKRFKIDYEPPPGFCSKLDVADGLYKLIDSHPDGLWFMLTQIDYDVGAQSGIEREIAERLEQSTFLSVAPMFLHQQIQRSLRSGTVDRLPKLASQYVDACARVPARVADFPYQTATAPTIDRETFLESENSPLGKPLLAVAVLRIAGSDDSLLSTLSAWRGFCVNRDGFKKIPAWIESLQKVLALDSLASERLLFSRSADLWSEKLPAAINLLRIEGVSAVQLLSGQSFVIQCLDRITWLNDIAPQMAELFAASWRRQLNFREQFWMADITLPSLEQACNLPDSNGRAKAATILREAFSATNTSLSPGLAEFLNQLVLTGRR